MTSDTKNHLILSGCSMAGSLLGYYLCANNDKDHIPATLIGGFVGGVIGAMITK
jgi:hypothetical protein